MQIISSAHLPVYPWHIEMNYMFLKWMRFVFGEMTEKAKKTPHSSVSVFSVCLPHCVQTYVIERTASAEMPVLFV
jgi:hypothetical protein